VKSSQKNVTGCVVEKQKADTIVDTINIVGVVHLQWINQLCLLVRQRNSTCRCHWLHSACQYCLFYLTVCHNCFLLKSCPQ